MVHDDRVTVETPSLYSLVQSPALPWCPPAAGDRAALAELAGQFVDNAPLALSAARSALRRRAWSKLWLVGHQLAGSCATLGFHRMTVLCMELAAAASRGPVVEAPLLLDKLEAEVEQTKDWLLGGLTAAASGEA